MCTNLPAAKLGVVKFHVSILVREPWVSVGVEKNEDVLLTTHVA
jgi:hypothetical protein